MTASKKLILVLLPLVAGAGCAPASRYKPAPISPVATAGAYEKRTLADPALKTFLERNLGHAVTPWPRKVWDLPALELAALYLNPAMGMARAEAARAEAAVTTAQARPNPSLRVAPGVPSPYLFGLDFALPVETAGKRGYRTAEAAALSEAARLALADTAWQVSSRARRALVEHLLATRELALLENEESLHAAQVRLWNERLEAGESARTEVNTARLALVDIRLGLRASEGRAEETKAALAAAIGIPGPALDGARFAWNDFDHPPAPGSLSAEQIQRHAVLDRLDVRRALAKYAASEAALQLEIAKQYPDVRIGPGYQFEERNNFFTLGFSITLPIFNRNQGPIAEAKARREQAAAQFLSRQARAIAESERALAAYRSAAARLREAEDALSKLQHSREQMTLRAVALGETDRMALNAMQLETAAAEQQKLAALRAAQTAFGALEDAVERPLAGEGFLPPAQARPESPGAHQ